MENYSGGEYCDDQNNWLQVILRTFVHMLKTTKQLKQLIVSCRGVFNNLIVKMI